MFEICQVKSTGALEMWSGDSEGLVPTLKKVTFVWVDVVMCEVGQLGQPVLKGFDYGSRQRSKSKMEQLRHC